MIKIYFIRHSLTLGNEQKKYIGITDQSLSDAGKALLLKKTYPQGEVLFVSPMKRCKETAQLLYPEQSPVIIEELKESNFGTFENKNAIELSGNPDYQKWIDSNGTMAFPGGEDRKAVLERTICGFEAALASVIGQGAKSAVFVVHGGTIMHLLSTFGIPKQDFYSWQTANGCGYQGDISKEMWIRGKKEIGNIQKITGGETVWKS